MGSCPACGAPTETGDRFCSACGDVLGGLSLVEPQDTGWASPGSPDEPELLRPEPALAGLAIGPPPTITPRGRLVAAAGLLAVAVVVAVSVSLWAIGRGASGSDRAEDTARPASTTTSRPPTETDAAPPVSDQAAATDETAGPDTVPVYDPASGAPVLGRPIGWSLLVGRSYATRLERLDLDTGQRVRYDGVTGGPVAALDGRLVLQHQNDDGSVSLDIVPLDDPGAKGVEMAVGNLIVGLVWPVAPAPEGGLWVTRRRPRAAAGA